jgi:DNA-binding transcriptional LysR family regulator
MNAKTSLRSFNLNTLPILREILRHGSVSKAAKALNVSQPALSGALKQLRHQFDDELIVRSHGSIKLTPKAEAMLAPLEQALSAVQQLILPATEDPSAPPTVLRIATTDHIMNLLGGPITQILLQEELKVMPHFLSASGHTAGQLLNGEIDCIIMPKLSLVGSHVSSRDQDSLNSELLFSEPLVGIGRRDDQELERGLSVKDYLERPHVSLDLDAERNISVERAFLAGNSLQQNDIAKFSCYAALIGIVAATRCIALVPASLAKAVEFIFNIQLFNPPLAFPPLEWTMIWHRRNDSNEKFAQCRTILKSCVRHMTEEISDDSKSYEMWIDNLAPRIS